MEFNKFSIDTDFDDLSEEEAKATLKEFMEKHEENIEFVSNLNVEDEDEIESLREAQEQNQEYCEKLAGEIADFDSVPLSADELAEYNLSRLHDMKGDLEYTEDGDEDNEGDEENFSKQERKSPNFKEQDEPSEFSREAVGNISGIVLE